MDLIFGDNAEFSKKLAKKSAATLLGIFSISRLGGLFHPLIRLLLIVYVQVVVVIVQLIVAHGRRRGLLAYVGKVVVVIICRRRK